MRWAASSWSATVFTVAGYTQPSPSAWPSSPTPVLANSLNVVQSLWVAEFGPCPLIWAM